MNKKFVGIIFGILVLSMSVTCFANTGWFDFQINLGTHQSTYNVTKSNSKEIAYVTQTASTAAGSDKLWYRVRRTSDGTPATESIPNIQNREFALNYESGKAQYNREYFLNIYNDPCSLCNIVVEGYWNP